ncbi:Na+/solute symporter [Saitoella complicata NRRL Y-17804]|uniref:Na+/solute symporter n=1 Tax=Saitoella complicata (strain BCRC 22490 / CBS 7301 / JCM 7358 / NBRC 10748 / NRRL Y-17804) TaxID=698492 RepID=UPI000867FC97|nr:Na+/solute symporter [Saitoella complicata NRRL Y-17804]ODQ53354.1 Na+/solute symporter [Saitoella complicata NRRL Y-17804]
MAIEAPLSQGVGYGVTLGLGGLFALGMTGLTAALRRYQGDAQTSEEFSTASHSVKTGLVAAAVVSSWTWAATLLQSSSQAYNNGVSGPFWYASGATVQILLFAVIAIELKRKAPAAHTFLEVVRARYGTAGHIVYAIFGLFTNILVTAMLLTGGSAVMSSLTGMHTVAACWLLPVGVIIYTVFGGIKATFLTDYAHTLVILIIIIIFTLTTYVTSDLIGSPEKMYELLVEAAERHPVAGNAEGSYLTMRSSAGIIFFVINLVGNFGTVFLDNGYFQKAISANPAHALSGYILGGLTWFSIPWVCATTMGLAAIALENNPAFPTYPNRMDAADVSAGLTLPYAAVALLGKGGAVATVLLIFMAVTSAMSAELIAVSSIFTYDIYRTYINPKASGKRLIAASHAGVAAWGVVMAAFSTMLYYVGVSMGFLYLFMGVIISSAVIPSVLTLLWKGQNKQAAVMTPILGIATSISVWLGTTQHYFGEINVVTAGSDMPMLWGNVASLLSPLIFIPIMTLIFKPDNYDWEGMKNIQAVIEDPDAMDDIPEGERANELRREISRHTMTDTAALDRASKIAKSVALFLTISMLILWPLPMFGSSYVFSKSFFKGWVVVGCLWIFFALFSVGLFPLWEGRQGIATVVMGMWGDMCGRRPKRPMPDVYMDGTDADVVVNGHGLKSGMGRSWFWMRTSM